VTANPDFRPGKNIAFPIGFDASCLFRTALEWNPVLAGRRRLNNALPTRKIIQFTNFSEDCNHDGYRRLTRCYVNSTGKCRDAVSISVFYNAENTVLIQHGAFENRNVGKSAKLLQTHWIRKRRASKKQNRVFTQWSITGKLIG
jgi:hypothetical protein